MKKKKKKKKKCDVSYHVNLHRCFGRRQQLHAHVSMPVLIVIVLRLKLGRRLLVGPLLRLCVADERVVFSRRLLQDTEVLEKAFGHRSTHHGCG
jgi:hypothetical protein